MLLLNSNEEILNDRGSLKAQMNLPFRVELQEGEYFQPICVYVCVCVCVYVC